MAYNAKPILIERYEWEKNCPIEEIISDALKIANTNTKRRKAVNFEHQGVEMTVYSDKCDRIPKEENTPDHYLQVFKRRLKKQAEK